VADPPFNWQCPFCGRPQTVTGMAYGLNARDLDPHGSKYGQTRFVVESIACSNPSCGELSVAGAFFSKSEAGWKRVQSWKLRPQSEEVPQPEYIPAPIRQDYYEACRIRDLSPKASATISRRCLQGMIRDFCGITKSRLIDEIKELRRQVDAGSAARGVSHDTMDAIDHVRSLGNIGAHMERDIDLIVEIDPDEAQHLIGLVELLFKDWYVAREDRRQRLEALGAVAADKKAITEQRKLPAPQQALPTGDF
jgi:hypothetical protein